MNYVEEYINKIKSGKIKASKKIKQFYINIIEPILKDENDRYYFDEEPGLFFIEFIEKFCKQSKGKWNNKKINLLLFQKAKYQTLLGVKHRETDKRRFTEIFDIRGRKNGKSEENSIFALFMLLSSNGAEIYVSATNFAQASRIWEETRSIIEKSAVLKKRFSSKVFPQKTISNKKNDSSFKVLSKNTDSQDGLNVKVAIIDEVHQLNREVYDLLKQGTSAQEQPILSMITTAGFVREGLFDDMYSYSKKVLDGVIEDDTLMALIYEQDDAKEIYDSTQWEKSNPAINSIKDIEFLKQAVQRMSEDPNFANSVKVKDFNIIGVENSAWLPYEVFNNEEKYGEEEMKQFNNTAVIGGFDLSRNGDITAFTTLLFDNEKHKIIAETMYWITSDFLKQQKDNRTKVPWDAWIDRGLVRISGDKLIDYHDIANYVSNNFQKRGLMYQKIMYDAYSASYLIEELASMGYSKNYCLQPARQGFKTLSIPLQTLTAHLKEKKIIYQNNPVTKWCLSNCELEMDRNGNEMLKKGITKQYRKIDGVATILNCYVALCENIASYLYD